jgi:streptomycin 6-kinase
VSEDNIRRWSSIYGEQAQGWLASLPGIVTGYAEEWELTINAPLEGGTASAVISAMRHDSPAVLKIHPPWVPRSVHHKTSAETEAAAYKIWAGRHAPRLLENDAQALLLEHITDAQHSPDMDAHDMTSLIAQVARPISGEALLLGIPFLQYEIQKRYDRASASRHPEISGCLLFNACSLASLMSFTPPPHAVNFSREWELVHGDLKPKNILQRTDGTNVVIDPSPAIGNRLYDATLWTIDKPEGIVERCNETAECLEINPRVIGNLAIALAIPEICLASPARATATLEYIREFAGTRDLEGYFISNQTMFDWTDAYYVQTYSKIAVK